jgi:5-methylcytosine-specific restriction endonuclease McrA
MTIFQAKNGSKWIRRAKRLRIYGRDCWKCTWCGCDVYSPGKSPHGPAFNPAGYPKGKARTEADPLRMATLDHVLPREHGGGNETGNLLTACITCNEERGSRSPLQFAYQLQYDHPGVPFFFAADVLDRVIHAITKHLPPKETPC